VVTDLAIEHLLRERNAINNSMRSASSVLNQAKHHQSTLGVQTTSTYTANHVECEDPDSPHVTAAANVITGVARVYSGDPGIYDWAELGVSASALV
jgi:hypothetical protein